MLTCIDYFAGIGAWELATEILEQIYGYQVFTTYQFVEILPSAQQVLRAHYPLIPIHSDNTLAKLRGCRSIVNTTKVLLTLTY